MNSILIRNACLLNEGTRIETDVLVRSGRIEKIASCLSGKNVDIEIDAEGQFLIPGMIDDQVHFREPGLTHKGCIASESRAAVAGGITSYMDMPNTAPPTLTLADLADKEAIARISSVANYGFHFGVSAANLDTIAHLDPNKVAGVKVFMGATTGDLLVDDPVSLERLFQICPTVLLAHCESNPRIKTRKEEWSARYGQSVPAIAHSQIRDAEACFQSSSYAVGLAKRFGTNLHVLHITTARELELFEGDMKRKDVNVIPSFNKNCVASQDTTNTYPSSFKGYHNQITAEACVHHLTFDDRDYLALGNRIKCNPSIKTVFDKEALQKALLSGKITLIGTDHAPHTAEEKDRPYFHSPAGLPLAQHALPALFELVEEGLISPELLVGRTSHAVAERFAIKERGFVREGFWADLVLLEHLRTPFDPSADPVFSRCGWTPFVGRKFHYRVRTTIVSGQLAWHEGKFPGPCLGKNLQFFR